MEKRKLCFIVHSHHSHTMGGAEYRCKLLMEHFIEHDLFDINYLCVNTDPNYVPVGYQIHKVGSSLNKYGLFFDIFHLYKALNKIRPDIIYQNGGSSFTGIAAYYAKKNRSRLVHQICNDNSLKRFSGLRLKTRAKNFFDNFLYEYGIQNANIIVCQSERQSDLLFSRFGRRCDIIVPLGHPLPMHKVVKAPEIRILWISNFKYHQKQPHLFIEMAKRLQSYKNASFIMIGGSIGRTKEFHDLLKQMKGVSNLTYLGQVSQEEVDLQLRQGHVLVNTSLYEGFPNTFVQAWMREVPVVSLTVDPNDILKKNKIGFHSDNFEQLVTDVALLIQNKQLREEMGKNALFYAKENHSLAKMAERVVTVFR